MGTVAGKLSYLAYTKDLFKDRLNSLGAEILSTTTFRNYLTWLDTFYGEVSDKTDISQNGVVGRTSQETTSISGGDEYDSPSPDYPQKITNLSGDVEYKVRGKNKLPFPYTETSHTHNGITYTINDDGTVLVNGTATAQSNTKLYGNYQEVNNKESIGKYLYGGTNEVRIRALNHTGDSYTVLATDTGNGTEIDTTVYKKYYIEISVLQGVTVNNVLIKPMVLDSLDDLKYEPYISESFPLSLGDIDLCNISDYKDRIYSQNGKFYLEKNINKVVLNGSESWARGTIQDYYRYTLSLDTLTSANTVLIYSTYYRGITYNNRNSDYFNTIYANGNIGINTNVASTLTEFKSWLNDNNTIIYYVLATPTTTEITEENYPTLYSQLLAIQEFLTKYKINKEFLLDYSSPEIEY